MRKSLIPFAFALLAVSNFLLAGDKAQAEALVARPFLYEIKKDDKVSYILGSLHYGLGTSDFPLWMTELHKHSKVHAYEILYSDFADFQAMQDLYFKPTDPKTIRGFKDKMRKRHGRSQTYFRAQEIDRLVDLGFSKELAEVFPTDRCSLFHFRDGFLKRPYRAMDEELMLTSFKLGIRAVPLENEEIRQEAERKYPSSSCDIRTFMWKDQVLERISSLQAIEEANYIAGDEITEQPDEHDYGLFFRNRTWLPKILELTQNGDAFITVGVLHLHSRWGILESLRNEGYMVTRVTRDPREPRLLESFETTFVREPKK